jgi:hypothetical protein
MYRAGMRHLLDFYRAAGRTGNQFLLGLFLIILETGKPGLKAVFFLAEKIVNHHEFKSTT